MCTKDTAPAQVALMNRKRANPLVLGRLELAVKMPARPAIVKVLAVVLGTFHISRSDLNSRRYIGSMST